EDNPCTWSPGQIDLPDPIFLYAIVGNKIMEIVRLLPGNTCTRWILIHIKIIFLTNVIKIQFICALSTTDDNHVTFLAVQYNLVWRIIFFFIYNLCSLDDMLHILETIIGMEMTIIGYVLDLFFIWLKLFHGQHKRAFDIRWAQICQAYSNPRVA
ncbi:hypothetical protein ACJX0J_010322, partial [Zea mays]